MGKSLGMQFETQVIKRVRQTMYEQTLEMMMNLCTDIVGDFMANRKFYNITGNAYTSFTVGLFYKGRLVWTNSVTDQGVPDPTMPTLRKGQVYGLGQYYEGDDVSKDHPYKGEMGKGRQWGPTLGLYRIKQMHPRKRKTWDIIAICPVEYATANKNIFDTMNATALNLPNLFSSAAASFRLGKIGSI